MDDALHATRAAVEEGAVPGGGEASVVLNNVASGKGNYGFNAATEEYGDMLKMGILDPTKVVHAALQHSASISWLMITTEAMIEELPQPYIDVPPADMGGMGGMM